MGQADNLEDATAIILVYRDIPLVVTRYSYIDCRSHHGADLLKSQKRPVRSIHRGFRGSQTAHISSVPLPQLVTLEAHVFIQSASRVYLGNLRTEIDQVS